MTELVFIGSILNNGGTEMNNPGLAGCGCLLMIGLFLIGMLKAAASKPPGPPGS